LVEKATTDELFAHPLHPYTKALLSAIPLPEISPRTGRVILQGEITSPIDPPDACRFSKRCNYAEEQCRRSCPALREITPGHFVACHIA